jgi:very-short-patch-repair endonuclease
MIAVLFQGDMSKPLRPHWRASVKIQSRARELRSVPTEPELRLWRRLRGGQIHGAFFRRQYAIGKYIVDFIYARSKLIVEMDGESHAMQENYDRARTRWLEGRGYAVLRFATVK